jgi:cytochrome P450
LTTCKLIRVVTAGSGKQMMLNETLDDVSRSLEDELRAAIDQWLGDQPVYWNAKWNVWVATSYDAVAKILKDANTFVRNMNKREGSLEFWGPNHLLYQGLDTSAHRLWHAAHMRLTGEDFAEAIRKRIREISHEVSTRLVNQGHAELVADYANMIPFLAGYDYLGFDPNDTELKNTLWSQLPIREVWKHQLDIGDGVPLNSKVAQEGLAAIQIMTSAMLPTIMDRRDHPRDDLISKFWIKGREIFPNWNERDVVSNCWSNLDNEAKLSLRGLLYILSRNQELQSILRRDPSLVDNFVEEGIRFLSPKRTIVRTATKDTVLDGQQIRRNDVIYAITATANRDETLWPCPYHFDHTRPEEGTSFAFGYGAGYCVGRYVGRSKASEAIKALLSATSSFAIDPSKPEPKWKGDMYHVPSPVHVVLRR